MIRMIFAPSLKMTPPKMERLITKLQPLNCRPIIEQSGRAQIIIETDQLADNLAWTLNAKNYTYCKSCNTLHFWTVKETFRCLCGMYLNKVR
jgi:hypothetical protein